MVVVSQNVRTPYSIAGTRSAKPALMKRAPPSPRIKLRCDCGSMKVFGHVLDEDRKSKVVDMGSHKVECILKWKRRMVTTRMKARLIVDSQQGAYLQFMTVSCDSAWDLGEAISNLQGNWLQFRDKSMKWRARGHEHPWQRIYWWFAVMEITPHKHHLAHNARCHDECKLCDAKCGKEGWFHPHLHVLLFSATRFNDSNFSWSSMHDHWRNDSGSKMQMNFRTIGQIGRVKTRKAIGYLTKYFSKGEVLWGGLHASVVKANGHILKGCHFTRGYYCVPLRSKFYRYCCGLAVTWMPRLRGDYLFICAHGARILAPG